MQALELILAAMAAGVAGFLLKGSSAKAEKQLFEARNRELAEELTKLKGEVARIQAESVARAGFESLAGERSKTILQLTEERDGLRLGLDAKTATEKIQAARISQLEEAFANEQKKVPEMLALLDNSKQALANQFESLAAGILDQKTKSFSDGTQKELGSLLTPLREQISDFRKKVEEAQKDSTTGVTKLETLIGALSGLNQQLSDEARNLTMALRGSSKAQGDWGEFILRDLLEKAGWREGEEFSFQQAFSSGLNEDGEKTRSLRTDVIVSMPGGRHLVIDSKVSLNAYTDAVNAETEEERKLALGEHFKSVRKHISSLAKAGYHNLPGVESPDFVVMFVPVEPAFLLALQGDDALWADAYKQGILLVGPTTLLFVIRIVDNLLQQELQARNVQDVMNRGVELYDKFVGFVGDMEDVGKGLRGADRSYSDAMKKLSEGRGNLIRQVEMLKTLKVPTKKSLPRNLLDAAGDEELALTNRAVENDEAIHF